MSRLRTLPVLLAVLVALGFGACGSDDNGNITADNDATTQATSPKPTTGATSGGTGTTVPPAGGVTIELKNLKFNPDKVTITEGQAVTWEWKENVLHNVTAKDGKFKSGNKDSGTYKHAFPKAGTYDYECTLHSGMEGSVEVK